MDTWLQLIVSALLLGGVYSLVTVGLTLVFGVLRIVNFAHGEYLMLAMFGTFWLYTLFGLSPYASLLVIPLVMFLFGILTERLVVRPTLKRPHMVQVFATLGLSMFLVYGAQALWSANYRSVQTPLSSVSLALGPVSVGLPRVLSFCLAMALALGLYLFLRLTYVGKAIQATAENATAARLMGINVNRIYSLTFALGSAITGAAGAILMPLYYAYPGIGLDFVLIAFVVAVMGGLGSVPGAIGASFIVAFVEVLSGFFIATAFKQAIYFVAFVLVLVFRPAGIFGVRGAEALDVQ